MPTMPWNTLRKALTSSYPTLTRAALDYLSRCESAPSLEFLTLQNSTKPPLSQMAHKTA